MKTIALNEQTFQLLQRLKVQRQLSSYDVLLKKLVQERESVPDSLFGILKNKAKPFTHKEREQIWSE